MEQADRPHSDTGSMLKKLHERPQMPLADWLQAPAHVHYKAFRMSDPPAQRQTSREEFLSCLAAFSISKDQTVLREAFGYGVKEAASGERLVVVWQSHTEYYNYQLWHVPPPGTADLSFGPLAFSGYNFPVEPLGTEVCRLDILLSAGSLPARERIRDLFPGPMLYGSRIFEGDTALLTSFTPDEQGRERYWVTIGSPIRHALRLKDIVDAIVRIETYYHLLLMQKPLFSAAIDQVYKFEQVHLKQREIISGHIAHADAQTLQRWLNTLTQDLLKTNRMPQSESLFGKLLNSMLSDSRQEGPRKQLIDGSTLPDYDVARRYLGPAGGTMTTEPTGWFVTGFTLSKEEQ